jgi:uncharacterized protein (TIGR02421 family)
MAELRRMELRLKGLCMASRMLPALTAENAAAERRRLTAELQRGGMPVPDWRIARQRVPAEAFRLIDELRLAAEELPGGPLYVARLDEIELDLMLIDALGRPRAVRPLSARRYGTGDAIAPTALGPLPLSRCARILLDEVQPAHEPLEVAADGGPESLGAHVRALADRVGLDVTVRIEPQLAAGAAAGERTVFVAPRKFGRVEARRLAVHEVLGHLVAAANGRAQPVRLLEWGTAGSFVDQEGLALYLEHVHGVMDATRLRTLAARVIAADMMHRGASFAETARKLVDDEHFPPAEAVAIAERAHRGGGVARDVGYLLGFLRVHDAITRGEATVDELRCGRVSLQALPVIAELRAEGYARSSAFRPNLCRSFSATNSGTMPLRSPPSEAASLISDELTKK